MKIHYLKTQLALDAIKLYITETASRVEMVALDFQVDPHLWFINFKTLLQEWTRVHPMCVCHYVFVLAITFRSPGI